MYKKNMTLPYPFSRFTICLIVQILPHLLWDSLSLLHSHFTVSMGMSWPFIPKIFSVHFLKTRIFSYILMSSNPVSNSTKYPTNVLYKVFSCSQIKSVITHWLYLDVSVVSFNLEKFLSWPFLCSLILKFFNNTS